MDGEERPNRSTGRRRDAQSEPNENQEHDSGRESEAHGVGEHDETEEDRPSGDGGEAGESADDIECAVGSWGEIWNRFAEARMKKGSSAAWAGLQIDFARNAATLVPTMLNGKDYTAMVSDVEERIKNESGTEKADPMEAVAAWLRNDETETIQ